MAISGSVLLKMRNVSDKSSREFQNTILCSITSGNLAVYNVEEYGTARQPTDGSVIGRKHFARWITKATDTHPEYVTLIAFPRQQWLRERASVIRLYVNCLSCCELCRVGN
jgi:hypothetical protein